MMFSLQRHRRWFLTPTEDDQYNPLEDDNRRTDTRSSRTVCRAAQLGTRLQYHSDSQPWACREPSHFQMIYCLISVCVRVCLCACLMMWMTECVRYVLTPIKPCQYKVDVAFLAYWIEPGAILTSLNKHTDTIALPSHPHLRLNTIFYYHELQCLTQTVVAHLLGYCYYQTRVEFAFQEENSERYCKRHWTLDALSWFFSFLPSIKKGNAESWWELAGKKMAEPAMTTRDTWRQVARFQYGTQLQLSFFLYVTNKQKAAFKIMLTNKNESKYYYSAG